MKSPYTGINYFPNSYYNHTKKKWILKPTKNNLINNLKKFAQSK